jgi:hypothetical protein
MFRLIVTGFLNDPEFLVDYFHGIFGQSSVCLRAGTIAPGKI